MQIGPHWARWLDWDDELESSTPQRLRPDWSLRQRSVLPRERGRERDKVWGRDKVGMLDKFGSQGHSSLVCFAGMDVPNLLSLHICAAAIALPVLLLWFLTLLSEAR